MAPGPGCDLRAVTNGRYSARFILLFWAPLAAQWLMMGLEGPFLTSVIARLGEPAYNLAAYGVAYAFAILVESPVIMLMSASIALVEDADSYRRLRRFAHLLNALSTGLLLLALIPALYDPLMRGALGLPDPVADLVYGALWILLPWPAAIGDRRFLQGIMIRAGETRRVAYGTALRLVAMGATGGVLALTDLPGAYVGAAALSVGVVVEALAVRWMAAGAVRAVRARTRPAATGGRAAVETLREGGAGAEEVAGAEGSGAGEGEPTARSYREIARFYYPLALTSLIGLTVQPLLTFFMGHAPSPVQSLAVFPVVNALSFLFRTVGLSYQEATIALLGRRSEHAPELARFGAGLALASSAGLALVAFTPLLGVWYGGVAGLTPELAAFARVPTQLAVLLPALSVALSFQRALLVQARRTRPVTVATALEVAAIAALFPLFGWGMGMVGVTAAMLAFVGGRLGGVVYLIGAALRALPQDHGRRARPATDATRDR